MGKVATGGGGEARELVPPRTYFGIVAGVYDIGTQTGGQFGVNYQFIITWELHTRKGPARNSKGHVLTISEFVNFAMGSPTMPSNLLKIIQAVEGRVFTEEEIKKGYDVEKLLGKHCKVQVVHKKKMDGSPKDAVESHAPLDEDDDVPSPELDHEYYEITEARDLPESLPKFVRDCVGRSKEFGGGAVTSAPARSGGNGRPAPVGAGVGADDDDDSIPF